MAGTLTAELAGRLPSLGPEAVVAFAVAMAGRVAGPMAAAAGPSTPSGTAPVYQTPAADKRRRRTPGPSRATRGRRGSRRWRSTLRAREEIS